jgi:hypothetical protein
VGSDICDERGLARVLKHAHTTGRAPPHADWSAVWYCGAVAWRRCSETALLGALLLTPPAHAGHLDDVLVSPWVNQQPAEAPAAEPAPAKPRDHFDDLPLHLEARWGAGTSVGLVGIVGEYNVLDRLALGAGIGLNPEGAIWGAHARLRPLIFPSRSGHTLHALFLEGSFSRGRLNSTDPAGGILSDVCEGGHTPGSTCYSVFVRPEAVSWSQFEFGWEVRLRIGFTLRVSGGLALALTRPNWRCERDGQPVSCEGESLPDRAIYVQTFALGYAF